jgi:hypothetical protein
LARTGLRGNRPGNEARKPTMLFAPDRFEFAVIGGSFHCDLAGDKSRRRVVHCNESRGDLGMLPAQHAMEALQYRGFQSQQAIVRGRDRSDQSQSFRKAFPQQGLDQGQRDRPHCRTQLRGFNILRRGA